MSAKKNEDVATGDEPLDEAAVPAGESPAPTSTPNEADGLRATVASLEDKLRRQQADFLNDVRRLQRQADERVRFAVQPVVSDLLGVADAIHGAIESLKEGEHEQRVAEGLRLVERELLDALGRHGVARIDALGKAFDPAIHEAILEVEGESPGRTVVQVTRPGFTLHGRVVRPASVIVNKPKRPAGPSDAPPPFPAKD